MVFFSPAVVYLLVSAVLFCVAVVVHFHSSTLSLPLSPVVSILTILLPILGFLNAYIHPTLLRRSHHSQSRIQQLTPLTLQTLQALVTTILATLLFETIIPSPALSCVLENDWMHMFRAKDGESIRKVQDVLNCCGFNSVRDRAYPFPPKHASTCEETYGRTDACRQPWTSALQSSSDIDFGITIAVGLMQIIGLLMMREGVSWWNAWQYRRWTSTSRRSESQRQLLAAVVEDEDEEEDEEEEEVVEPTSRGYGALEANGGPRLEPSRLNERNEWA